MKDFAGNEVKAGSLVVVKPSTRHSWMRFGFVVSAKNASARVISWNGKFINTNFWDHSVYVLANPTGGSGEFPKGFPEELKEKYLETFGGSYD